MNSVIFRADGNSETGLGHLYRLFSLAETIKGKIDFVFVTRQKSTTSVIPKDYSLQIIPESITLEQESNWLKVKYSPKEYIIVADGYHFNSHYQKKLKKSGYRLIYIDDLAEGHMYADAVINHSPYLSENDFKAEKYTRFYLGMDYAMVRPNFIKLAKLNNDFSKIKNVFINFGGADKLNLTHKTTKCLLQINQIENINIVLGGAYDQNGIYNLQKENASRINIYKNLSELEIIEIMQKSNFAIAPASTILFELFCIKMPIFSCYYVENQKKAYYSFKKLNLIGGCGNFAKIADNNLLESIKEFINLPNHESLIENQHKSIDGNQQIRHLELIKDQLI